MAICMTKCEIITHSKTTKYGGSVKDMQNPVI
jgi:hypothetical protein